MNSNKLCGVLWVVLALSVSLVRGEDLVVIGMDRDSGILFRGAAESNYYMLEFAMDLDGPWTNWGAVANMAITGEVMSVAIPMFFRVREVMSQEFPVYATGTPVYVESDPIFMDWLGTNTYVQTESDPLFMSWLDTNTYVQAELDPVWQAERGQYYTRSEADTLFATGMPVYVESDPLFSSWLDTNTYVQAESDPLFMNWLDTNTYVQAESDPLFTSWLDTNTYVQTESDPVWQAERGQYYTRSEADTLFATGTPVYVESDPLFTSWLDTNTYVEVEVDPLWQAERGNYYTRGEADALFATGTPLYVESDPIFTQSAAAGISETQVSQWEAAYSWGNHATSGYRKAETEFFIDPEYAHVETTGGVITVSVTAAENLWPFRNPADWISVEQHSFEFAMSDNTSPDERYIFFGPGSVWLRVEENTNHHARHEQVNFSGHHLTVAQPMMVLLEGGSFVMGATTNVGHESETWEVPQHTVTLDPFYMDIYLVTHDEMLRVMQWAYENGELLVNSTSVTNAHGTQRLLLELAEDSTTHISWDEVGGQFVMPTDKGAGYPCVWVTWHGAVAYANYRSQMERLTPAYDLNVWTCDWNADGYRLPTEAEWEYAARGGEADRRFPWGNEITHDEANYVSSPAQAYDVSPTRGYHPDWDVPPSPYTSPVKTFAPNAFGLHDMAGNVGEWCWDRWSRTYYQTSPGHNPRGPAAGLSRVVRGGEWTFTAPSSRVAARKWALPGETGSARGFRVVKPAQP